MKMDNMARELQKKAYAQGYNAGVKSLPISQLDWEDEFLPAYNRGYSDGKEQASQHGPSAANGGRGVRLLDAGRMRVLT